MAVASHLVVCGDSADAVAGDALWLLVVVVVVPCGGVG